MWKKWFKSPFKECKPIDLKFVQVRRISSNDDSLAPGLYFEANEPIGSIVCSNTELIRSNWRSMLLHIAGNAPVGYVRYQGPEGLTGLPTPVISIVSGRTYAHARTHIENDRGWLVRRWLGVPERGSSATSLPTIRARSQCSSRNVLFITSRPRTRLARLSSN